MAKPFYQRALSLTQEEKSILSRLKRCAIRIQKMNRTLKQALEIK
jgi:hypothetical protein